MLSTLHFDELHVISDLHLGGDRPSAQIFASTAELVALVDALAGGDPTRVIGLAINGDLVDFLAETPSTYFDPAGAIGKLERIARDPSFAPIFAALAKFLRRKNRTLVINLGNHDLELALPWVRDHLIDALCGKEGTARGRLRIVLDGTGVRCSVGGASVLLVHGNEVDSWNVADFERIRRIGRDLQFGNAVEPWIPNAGTQMVIDVMNGIKRRYPFVDLLKPEIESVVPTLLALDPSALGRLRSVTAVVGRRAIDGARMATGFLGDADSGGAPAPAGASAVERPMPPGAIPLTRTEARAREEELMARIERELAKGSEPMDLVRSQAGAQLGLWRAAWNLGTGRPTHEVLREALERLDQDTGFEFGVEDETFHQLDALAGSDVDFLIAGHTHLERALRRTSGRGAYFNSGTWARLIRIAPEVRRNPATFERVFKVFQGGGMDALDAEPGLVIRRCSIVSIVDEGAGRIAGELRHMRTEPGGPTMHPVPGSRLAKG